MPLLGAGGNTTRQSDFFKVDSFNVMYLTIFFDQTLYSTESRIDQKSYGTGG